MNRNQKMDLILRDLYYGVSNPWLPYKHLAWEWVSPAEVEIFIPKMEADGYVKTRVSPENAEKKEAMITYEGISFCETRSYNDEHRPIVITSF